MGSSHERAEDADPISAKPARLGAKPRVEPMHARVIIEVMEEAERSVLKVFDGWENSQISGCHASLVKYWGYRPKRRRMA